MKSVIVFVRNYHDETDWVETATFGTDCHYHSAAQFVSELQKLYKQHNPDNVITDVVIG